MIKHPIEPVFDKDSKILILGSFPSVKSREQGFFYGHPQNRFWKVLSAVFGRELPVTVQEKRAFLSEIGVAVWDVISECDISGSADDSIKNVTANDIGIILKGARIKQIYVNGKTAHKYYRSFLSEKFGEAICLPSTSPANAAYSLDRLIGEWKVIKE